MRAQAAIRAGYSAKNANDRAAQLIAKTEIIAAIDAAIAKRSERAQIDAAWVLRRLVDEAEAESRICMTMPANFCPSNSGR